MLWDARRRLRPRLILRVFAYSSDAQRKKGRKLKTNLISFCENCNSPIVRRSEKSEVDGVLQIKSISDAPGKIVASRAYAFYVNLLKISAQCKEKGSKSPKNTPRASFTFFLFLRNLNASHSLSLSNITLQFFNLLCFSRTLRDNARYTIHGNKRSEYRSDFATGISSLSFSLSLPFRNLPSDKRRRLCALRGIEINFRCRL